MEKQKTSASRPAKGRSSSTRGTAKKTSIRSKAKPAKASAKTTKDEEGQETEPFQKQSSRTGRITNSDEQRKAVNTIENSYDEEDEEMEEGTYLRNHEEEHEEERVSERAPASHSLK